MAGGKGKATTARTRTSPPDLDDPGLVVRPIGGSSGTTPSTKTVVTAVPGNLAVITLLATNALRLGYSIFNSSTKDTLYVLAHEAAGPVSPTLFTVALCPGGYFEDPYHYTDLVTGVWGSVADPATLAMVTEYTP